MALWTVQSQLPELEWPAWVVVEAMVEAPSALVAKEVALGWKRNLSASLLQGSSAKGAASMAELADMLALAAVAAMHGLPLLKP